MCNMRAVAHMVGRGEDMAQSANGFQHEKMAHRRFRAPRRPNRRGRRPSSVDQTRSCNRVARHGPGCRQLGRLNRDHRSASRIQHIATAAVFRVPLVLKITSQKGPPENSKGTSGFGKGPVPPTPVSSELGQAPREIRTAITNATIPRSFASDSF
jgi:hypothetical protein